MAGAVGRLQDAHSVVKKLLLTYAVSLEDGFAPDACRVITPLFPQQVWVHLLYPAARQKAEIMELSQRYNYFVPPLRRYP